MNDELKNKIQLAKKDETYWNDEAMIDDLIKQGYKKEDINEILRNPNNEIKEPRGFLYGLVSILIGLLLGITLSTVFMDISECRTKVGIFGGCGGPKLEEPFFVLISIFFALMIGTIIKNKKKDIKMKISQKIFIFVILLLYFLISVFFYKSM